ncbi:FAD-dependent oxidoreductase [Paracoccus luteus]|uniref:FAD-dependent oxidoreductase n=1 Tax=Paracoccus luteus TaxID=2508543 RepID=UPI001070631B|nr:FAD/NAD(P)-binding oxidoreductase [Paracoccus luteus]
MIGRRSFLAGQAALAAALTTAGAAAAQTPAQSTAQPAPAVAPVRNAIPRQGKGPRIVVAGGGWGGMTTARHLRDELPDAEVILIERNPVFWTCPFSNKWLIDVVDTDFLIQDMTIPARTYGYRLLHTEISGIDRAAKTVQTGVGTVDYDLLVIAGGIRNAYDKWFGNDLRAAEYTRTHFPSAYIPNAEHFALKRKLRDFKGGHLVMTLPPPPHRCPPSPYERACIIAWHIKKNNIPGKITILDPKPGIAPITGGFTAAFQELYPDIITHVPNAAVEEVDPFNKRILTYAGEFEFDDAILMPPHQAADIAWMADLVPVAGDGTTRGWADTDPRLFTALDDEDVYVVGDAVGFISDQFGYYPKSAHVANALGKIVARNIGERVRGEDVVPVLPDNLCFLLVNAEPLESVAVKFTYDLDPAGKVIQTLIDVNERTDDHLAEDYAWFARTTGDFLA